MRDYMARPVRERHGQAQSPLERAEADLLRDPEFRKAYEELEPEFQLAGAIIALRAAKGLTQEEMAGRAEIKRPMLSRIVGAKDLPTLPTLPAGRRHRG